MSEARISGGYKTMHEIEFINGLGTWSESAATKAMGREELLRRYIGAADIRADWGAVSKMAAVQHARECLDVLTQESKQ